MNKNKCFGLMMKSILCASIVFIFHFSFLNSVYAQKYACVNTDYILKSIPDYSNAQKRIDKYVADWQKELKDKQDEVDAMRVEFEQESYLLPENLKRRRSEEIKEKEQEIKTLQQQRFGAGGDLDKKCAELLKPVQDRVYSIIERIAHEKNYAFVFDKAGSATLLFVNKKYDISDEVLELMGYKPGEKNSEQGNGQQETDKPQKRPTNPELRDPSTRGRSLDKTPPPLGGGKTGVNRINK